MLFFAAPETGYVTGQILSVDGGWTAGETSMSKLSDDEFRSRLISPEDLKDSVKRLRITAAQHLPATFAVRGALRTEFVGRDALVAVAGVNRGLIDELRTAWNATVDVEDLSLEDIFLEMHHG